MTPSPYLTRLARHLRRGLSGLPDAFRRRETDFLLCGRNPDGAFSGRSGPSDLYYTVFALRAADVLDLRSPRFWRQTADFVRKNSTAPHDVTDCLGLLSARDILRRHRAALWCETCTAEREAAVRTTLARFRLPLGGFAQTPDGDMSLYHTFLAALAYELLGETVPDVRAAVELVASRQGADGGFAEFGRVELSGTNPTAAAVAFLGMSGALSESAAGAAAGFLLDIERADGGFAAHARAPVSDLMSTFTALVTLADLGRIRDVKLSSVGRYVRSLAADPGGFVAATGDDAPDVEYTYYGLGTLALLAAQVR